MNFFGILFAATIAGGITGLLGAGGGSILVLLLLVFRLCSEKEVFFISLSIMIPVSLTVLLHLAFHCSSSLSVSDVVPYLLGGFVGGLTSGKLGSAFNVKWLHLAFGLLIIWGGFQFI